MGRALVFFLLGAATGLVLVARIAWFASRASVTVGASELVLELPGADRRVIVRRGVGRVIHYAKVKGGRVDGDQWLLWIGPDGTCTWLTFGRQWPIDELLGAAENLGLQVERPEKGLKASQIRARHPGAVPWIEAHAVAIAVAVGFGGTLLAGAVLALV